jgi:hypothetical protein
MVAPSSLVGIVGYRKGVPNFADIKNNTSRAIANEMLKSWGIDESAPTLDAAGPALEQKVEEFLAAELPRLDPIRKWEVGRHRQIRCFAQYEHLKRLDDVVRANPTIAVEIGRDYFIDPDITVGVDVGETHPLLHAAISSKWTIRSDRVQNVRHEAVIMMRTRRGRLPHIVTVTLEPLPTRLASIARGTGEVDGVYHLGLDELIAATNKVGTEEQKRTLDELISQGRLMDISALPQVLAKG